MNIKSIIAAVVAFLSPLLAKKGIMIPPEFAMWVSTIFIFVSGLVNDGINLSFRDIETTLRGIIGAVAFALAAFGLDVPADAQLSLVGFIVWASNRFKIPEPIKEIL